MGSIFAKLREALWGRQMELVIVGLENSGKTTLLNQLATGEAQQTVPTVGLNVRSVKKDLGGQVQYRAEWGRYTKGTNAIIFVIDAHAAELISLARRELHLLLEDRDINGIPLLILSNKIDLMPHLKEPEIISGLNLDYIIENPWVVLSVSALRGDNIEKVIEWLLSKSKGK